jgi:hypothetical protein
MELVHASGETLSVVLAGHPKLTNDLRRPALALPYLDIWLLSHGEFPLSTGTGTFSRPLSVSQLLFRGFSSRIASAKREKGNSRAS